MKKMFILIIPLIVSIFYKKIFKKKKGLNINDFINNHIKPNSVLIAEYHRWHLECLPGYTKYFIDLGYNVDIIIIKGQKESMEKFEPKDNLKIFEYSNQEEIEKKLISFKSKVNKYKFSFIGTLDSNHFEFYKKMGYFDNPKTLFVIHHLDEMYTYGINSSISKNEVFSLSDYGIIPYLNPNYFGEFNLNHEKNKNTSFFITSTKFRNYTYLIKGVEYLKNKSINFKINVVGRAGKFNESDVPEELKHYFNFYGKVKYQKLYEIVQNSDFIILNLYPDQEIDNLFRNYRATGNSQLAYGFHKPVLIEENFVKTYKFSQETAIIYKGHNLSSAMLKAGEMSDEEYTNMSRNVKYLKESIYNISINNLKKVLELNELP